MTPISSSGTILDTATESDQEEPIDADWIIPTFVLIDTLMERLGHRTDLRAQVPDSEVILIAVAAAKYFQNHHERAVCILRESRYLSGRIDVRRFNRRLHKLADWWYFT